MKNITESAIEHYFDRLWPLTRSLTGEAVRETHCILKELIPLQTREIPSGTEVFDWRIPKEWNLNRAYIIDPKGNKFADTQENNLHIINYSIPFRGRVSKKELEEHLHSLPDMPDAIPYLSSYYKEYWGFCLTHRQRMALIEGDYEVCIDADLKEGSLTYSDYILPGKSEKEVMFTSYTCHPSLANNELSGPLVLAFLYQLIKSMPQRRYTYRFVLVPETIGSIAYLKENRDHLKKTLEAGLVLTCIGDNANFMYKKTRNGETLIDRVMEHYFDRISGDLTQKLTMNYEEYKASQTDQTLPRIINFFPENGSDDRQFNAIGNQLPVGSLMRSMYGTYDEYHTSLDNKDYISFPKLKEAIYSLYEIVKILEKNLVVENTIKNCEVQLGKRDLYPSLGGSKVNDQYVSALMWLLNLADGETDLLAMAQRSHIPFELMVQACQALLEKGVVVDRTVGNDMLTIC